jgi:hypothetical protein
MCGNERIKPNDNGVGFTRISETPIQLPQMDRVPGGVAPPDPPAYGSALWKDVRTIGVFSDSVWMCTEGLPEDKAAIKTLDAFCPSSGITHWPMIAALHKVLKACKAKVDPTGRRIVFKLTPSRWSGRDPGCSTEHYEGNPRLQEARRRKGSQDLGEPS